MNVLGSLKNRLKTWRLILQNKRKLNLLKRQELKRKKQLEKEKSIKEEELLGIRKYSKIEIVSKFIFGMFIGFFEQKAKTSLLEINTIKVIENKLKQGTNLSQEELLDIKKEIKYLQKSPIRKKEIKKLVNEKASVLEAKTKRVEEQKKLLEMTKADTYITPSGIDEITSNNLVTNYQMIKTYIKTTTKELKEYKKLLKELEEKVEKEKNYNALADLRFDIKRLKEKLNLLNKEHKKLKELDEFKQLKDDLEIREIDIFELSYNNDAIKSYMNKCESLLISIEIKQESIINPIKNVERVTDHSKSPIQENTQSKEQKKEDKKQKEIDMDTLLAEKLIISKIEESEARLERVRRRLNELPILERKRGLQSFFENFLSGTISLALSLAPISLFKNKIIGGLVTSIMLNNNIRTMRRMLTLDSKVGYYTVTAGVLEQMTGIFKIEGVYIDSLDQIKKLKSEAIAELGLDINTLDDNPIIQRLELLEHTIKERQKELIETKQNIKNLKQKEKVLRKSA